MRVILTYKNKKKRNLKNVKSIAIWASTNMLTLEGNFTMQSFSEEKRLLFSKVAIIEIKEDKE